MAENEFILSKSTVGEDAVGMEASRVFETKVNGLETS